MPTIFRGTLSYELGHTVDRAVTVSVNDLDTFIKAGEDATINVCDGEGNQILVRKGDVRFESVGEEGP